MAVLSKGDIDMDSTKDVAVVPEAGEKSCRFSWRDFDPATLAGSARDLAVELTTYRDRLDEILVHEGEYVVIKGDRIVGYHRDRDEALRAAIGEFGSEPVLVKR